MSTKRDRGECDARGCHERASHRVASFYPGEEAGHYCGFHKADEESRQHAAKISTYGQAQKWVQTGRALQQDPQAMGYIGHMMHGQQQQQIQYYQPGQQQQQQQQQMQQPQYYQPGQRMPQMQLMDYNGGACGPMMGGRYPQAMPQQMQYGACAPMGGPTMGGFAPSAPIPIPGAGYVPMASPVHGAAMHAAVPVARWV